MKVFIDVDSIINKENYEPIKSCCFCSICQGLIYKPKKCSKCENCFCSECIDEWVKQRQKCVFNCENPIFEETRIVRNLLSILIIKCPFGWDENIKYDDIEKHYSTCKAISYKEKYEALEKKYKLLEEKIKDLEKKNNDNNNNNLKSWQKMSLLHPHPLILCTTKRASNWYCDHCQNFYDNSHYSYLCTLCDYDLCENCFQ